MRRLCFKCTFLSDVVLQATSNTEGKSVPLDFIPGSNFLGMVAARGGYTSFGKDAFEVFHSGKVRFGDAHPLIGNTRTDKVPLSWHMKKGASLRRLLSGNEPGEIYNIHFVDSDQYTELINKGIQLQQQRNGYVTSAGQFASASYAYAQKSARDREKRRSKDQAMFGYFALPKGTEWSFWVEIDDEISDDTERRLVELLEQSNRLGKSRSAQYGHVRIERIENIEPAFSEDLKPTEDSHLYLYAQSRLALVNAEGFNTFEPTVKGLGLDENCVIDWSRSNIRYGRYSPYVSVRHNHDPERMFVEKGSVIAVKIPEGFDVQTYRDTIAGGVGLYVSEGFGKILINPDVVTCKTFNPEAVSSPKNEGSSTLSNSTLNDWLELKREKEQNDFALLHEVTAFINGDPSLVQGKKSQWGQIRALCNQASNSEELYGLLFDETQQNGHPRGFLKHGKAKEKWQPKLIDAIQERYEKNKENFLAFMKLLSIYAPKEDDKAAQGGENG
jgi:hypothetical protein